MKPKQPQLPEVIYFLISVTNRVMRKYSHKVLRDKNLDITVDQFVVLKLLEEEERLTQREIAQRLFKDNASITRIIELLVKKDYIQRSINNTDRRTFHLELTAIGEACIAKTKPVVLDLRAHGLEGISEEDIEITKRTLKKMMDKFS